LRDQHLNSINSLLIWEWKRSIPKGNDSSICIKKIVLTNGSDKYITVINDSVYCAEPYTDHSNMPFIDCYNYVFGDYIVLAPYGNMKSLDDDATIACGAESYHTGCGKYADYWKVIGVLNL